MVEKEQKHSVEVILTTLSQKVFSFQLKYGQ
jgi:hypothetical protein